MASIGPNQPPSNESTHFISSNKTSIIQKLKNLFIYLFQKIGINFAQHSKPLEGRALMFNPLDGTLQQWTPCAEKTNILVYKINDSADNPLFELQNVNILKPQQSDTLEILQNKLNVLKDLKNSGYNFTPESREKLNKLLKNVDTDRLEEQIARKQEAKAQSSRSSRITSRQKTPTPASAPPITSTRQYSPMDKLNDQETAQKLFRNSPQAQSEYNSFCRDNFTKTPETRMSSLKAFAQRYPQAFRAFLQTCERDLPTKNAFTNTWFDQNPGSFRDFQSFVNNLKDPQQVSVSSSPVYNDAYSISYNSSSSDPVDNLENYYKAQLSVNEQTYIRNGEYKIQREDVKGEYGWTTRPYVIRDNQGEIIKILKIKPSSPEPTKKTRREDWS